MRDRAFGSRGMPVKKFDAMTNDLFVLNLNDCSRFHDSRSDRLRGHPNDNRNCTNDLKRFEQTDLAGTIF
jgi:hypothetical protein